jgi:P27 family predicted phage terminase small subunit
MPPAVARDAVAVAEWVRLTELTQLKNAKVLTLADGPMLEATARAYAEYEAADLAIRADGGALTYTSTVKGGGIISRPKPEAAIRSDAWKRWVAGLTHFGLTPATRGKVERVDDEPEQRDPAEDHFS